ncbi:nucleotidyltransferase family protein [Agromyces aerolatus]|uniref:nucleotidyltransferase family protein n=1 Tax=Agromyces sp. LY-1074 TaxID=3074080 RepID=UPI00285FE7C4|nr:MULTISPECIES: nucleotidyltransferase domain-containing protein [unclassified Agromyces]MDR5699743.1 nucleotidyltransferase domain-containing protein [Agromyces sp. LY-1074]MDR5706039.1 nucleotidyltransferase domain-containing protein [Agromyces sp. LY-1358]
MHEESRRILVESARAGASAGLSQRQIAKAIGRSQPEVSRLLRFHGRSPLARALERYRSAILRRLARSGAHHVRVFGSVSRGQDGPTSDIDLLVDFTTPPSLFELAELEADLSELVGAQVDVAVASDLRANLAPRVLAEAVPL